MIEAPPQPTISLNDDMKMDKPLEDVPPIVPVVKADAEPEEGSAEYIRRRYFPDAPADDPNVAWMTSSPSESDLSSAMRFDLSGRPISAKLSSTLPTHLGLHHHAEGAHAGYTLDDVFLLSRSTAPAQRATMLGVLARIAHNIPLAKKAGIDGMEEVIGKEEDLRKRIIAAGVEAMSERGMVGANAIDVVWECVVGWDEQLMNVEGVELDRADDSAIKSLPLEFLLPQITTIFLQGAAVRESLLQLLSILHRLAQQSRDVANAITETPKLVPGVLQNFLLTPIPPQPNVPLPDPAALGLLLTLAAASRSNAKALVDIADALLRFITFTPVTSPYDLPLSTSLSVMTLRFYAVLATYGLYSHIASTAMSQFTQLGQYVVSEACTSNKLKIAWAGLLETWIVCAIDPHKTTPEHDILWSQVSGCCWIDDAAELQAHLGIDEKDWTVWSASWRLQAAWLEGCSVNGVRGGEQERTDFAESRKGGFENGREKMVIEKVIEAISQKLLSIGIAVDTNPLSHLRELARMAEVLSASIRLWLACLPPHLNGPPESPPFPLPFPQLSSLCATLVSHPLWSLVAFQKNANPYIFSFCRHISRLLSSYLRLSRCLPGISQDLWMAQAFSFLSRLMPGDEDFGLQVMQDLISSMTPEWAASRGLQVPSVVWDRGGMSVIKPFLENTIRPVHDMFIGPLTVSPQSISTSTTQQLPSPATLHKFGLPVQNDWTMTPLDHLLRSGDSTVFKALPLTWDASEVEVARASLFFAKIARDVLQRFALNSFVLVREEAVFGCMKVYMLEHGQSQNDSTVEVFRDPVVGALMNDLLRPYTIGAVGVPSPTSTGSSSTEKNLESVAVRFLGPSVPFFQYYTDFVALYDSISFSQPLFGRLLLPPTSMRYPPDYRKHLWCDFNHVVKTIQVPLDQVISGDLKDYLYPAERDPQLVGSYLRSLLQGSLQEFMRLVALHHTASNIWPDLQGEGEYNEERASKLMKVVADQGSNDVVKEVLTYRQPRTGALSLPPDCFATAGDEFQMRMEGLHRWGLDRLMGVFE